MIGNLLSHYWIAGEPEQVRAAQARDWFNDLREFHPDIVAEACGRWRRGEHRKPTIADIRKFCLEEQELRRPVVHQVDRAAQEAHREWRRRQDQEAADHRENWARGLGYPGGFRQMMDIGLVEATKNPPAVTGIPAPRSRDQRHEFKPSSEALRLARVQLGLEAPAALPAVEIKPEPDNRDPGAF